MVGSSAREPSSDLAEEEPAPTPDQYKRQRSAFVRVPAVPLPCPPVVEPPVYCDESTGLFGSELRPVPDEPAPAPVPLKSTGPIDAEPLLLPVAANPAPVPVTLKRTGRNGAELLLVPADETPAADPEPLSSTGAVD